MAAKRGFPTPPVEESAYCCAAYAFTPTGANQLTLLMGDKVLAMTSELEVEEMDDWVWCKHLRTGQEGYVPSTYLRVESQEVAERAMLREEIARLENSLESEQRIVAGFEEAIRSSKKASDKADVQERLKESRKFIYDMLNHLERLRARLGAFTSEDDEEEEEDDSGDEAPKPPPIKPFTGVLKSAFWTAESKRKGFKVRFEVADRRARPASSMPSRPRNSSTGASGSTEASKSRRKSEGDDLAAFADADWSASMWEERFGGKGWKRRFIVLRGDTLFIYRRPKPTDHAQRVELSGYTLKVLRPEQVSPNPEAPVQFCFGIYQSGSPDMVFATDTAADFERCQALWTKAMKTTSTGTRNGRQLTREGKRARRRSTEASIKQEGLALKALRNLDIEDGSSPTLRRATPVGTGAESTGSETPAMGRRSSSTPAPRKDSGASNSSTAATAAAIAQAIAAGGVPAQQTSVMQLMVAAYDYVGREKRELSFKKGDNVLRISDVNAEWFTAFREKDRATGIVPTAYFVPA